MSIVVRGVVRTDADLVAELGEFGIATVHEAQGRRGLLDSRLRPIYRPIRVAGTALTCEVAPGSRPSAMSRRLWCAAAPWSAPVT
jgi:4-hydroxy-4-methyl-2-oxoglutarate aldolase